jgi:serine/threonine protein kinase
MDVGRVPKGKNATKNIVRPRHAKCFSPRKQNKENIKTKKKMSRFPALSARNPTLPRPVKNPAAQTPLREKDLSILSKFLPPDLSPSEVEALEEWEAPPIWKKNEDKRNLVALSHAPLNLASVKPIGKGAFGKVYQGVTPEGEKVAVKIMTVPVSEFDEVLRELYVLRKVATRFPEQLSRADQILFKKGPDPYSMWLLLVSPLASNGTLANYLSTLPSRSNAQILSLIYNIVCGIATLHQLGITHNDLKPENILMFGDIPKIADFGMTLLKNPRFRRDTRYLVTVTYRAPEYLCTRKDQELWKEPIITPQADMWSLGIILLEILLSLFTRGRDLRAWDTTWYNGQTPTQKALSTAIPRNTRTLVGVKRLSPSYVKQCLPPGFSLSRDETGKEADASAADAIQIFNRLFNVGLEAKNVKPGSFDFDLFDIVSHLLRFNPKERWTAAQVLKRLWVMGQSMAPKVELKCPGSSILPPPPPPPFRSRRVLPSVVNPLLWGKLLEFAAGKFPSTDFKTRNARLLLEAADIHATYDQLVKDLKLKDLKELQAAYVLAALMHWGSSFTPWIFAEYKLLGFSSLEELLKEVSNLTDLWMK